MPLKLFDNILKLKGFPIQSAKEQYDQLLQSSSADQQELRWDILQHHLTYNRFYNGLVKDKKVDWHELPILTKRDLQQPLHQRLSDGYTVRNIFKGKTSGSSGHPFIFGKDKHAHALTWAAFHHAYSQHGIDLNSSLQARFYGIPLSGKGRYLELFKDFVSYRKRFPIFNLNEEVLDGFLDRFRKDSFDYINGYTSSILLLAKHCRSRNLVLKDICPSLNLCIVTSEMLFAEDRQLMQEHLGVPVINEYGASEVGLIAMEDPRGNMCINESQLFLEIVDNLGNPVEEGSTGRVLVTDLFNKAHPIIRYEIGDMAAITTQEDQSVLKDLQGRTSDIARLPSGKVVPGLTFYYVTKTIINDAADILEFVVVQKQHDHFEFSYVGTSELPSAMKSKIKTAMDQYLEPGLKASFRRLSSMDRSTRGKLKQFTSEVGPS
ncbi:phenylacetate--CoA ligase family protein [Nonlabens xiamenensis]|uniref:phenylacetate--CoA ligase family protein n=1 Tax=Nonlabens xiamenensis TaxID=2341043 RepID=UPI000F60C7EF|nr:phenylacetate--CoA ligase family protein [Nonlabens xiamenensis]